MDRTCPQCGLAYDRGDETCRQCGKDLPGRRQGGVFGWLRSRPQGPSDEALTIDALPTAPSLTESTGMTTFESTTYTFVDSDGVTYSYDRLEDVPQWLRERIDDALELAGESGLEPASSPHDLPEAMRRLLDRGERTIIERESQSQMYRFTDPNGIAHEFGSLDEMPVHIRQMFERDGV